jgi:hypothetical protein
VFFSYPVTVLFINYGKIYMGRSKRVKGKQGTDLFQEGGGAGSMGGSGGELGV